MSTLIERIEHVIKEKGLTFKRVERDCGLGNGTIKRWAEQSPRLDKLEKVSDYLHTSLDYLVKGEEHLNSASDIVRRLYIAGTLSHDEVSNHTISCDGVPLNEIESDLVAMFRLLDEKEREISFDFVAGLYEKATGEKTSIYSTYIDTDSQQKSVPTYGDNAKSGTA